MTASKIFLPGLLSGKVCVVTGAGTGLGRAAALELGRLGATVAICGRRVEPLEETIKLIRQDGGVADYWSLDIRNEADVAAMIDDVIAKYKRIDVLVNNAGGQFMAPAENITPKGFKTVLELNALGTWNFVYAVANKAMIPQRSGKIFSVTLTPHNGMPGMMHSGAARAAVENMTRTLSVEWARYGITLCALAAGHFDTEALSRGNKYPTIVSELAPTWPPLGRLGTVEEWGWLVAYLASPAGAYFSGTVISLDGARDNWYGRWPAADVAPDGLYPQEERRSKER